MWIPELLVQYQGLWGPEYVHTEKDTIKLKIVTYLLPPHQLKEVDNALNYWRKNDICQNYIVLHVL